MKHYLLIEDRIIDSGDLDDIILPLQLSVNIYEGEKSYRQTLSQFSIPQQFVFNSMLYQGEVNNGGHGQFYFNSTGLV